VKGRLSADGRVDATAPIAVRAQVADIALGPLVARFAPEARGKLDGSLSAAAELTVPWNDPASARGTARLEPVRLVVWGERWEARGPVTVRREPGRTVVEPFSVNGPTGEVTGRARIDDAGPIDATLRGRVPLALVPTMVPQVTDASGEIELELRAGGTRAAPTLLGQGRVTDGLVAARGVPQVVRGLTGRFSVRPDRLHVDELRGAIGSGTFQASGDVAIEGLTPGAYQLRLAARNVTTERVEGLEALWDADLELTGRGARAVVRGEARMVRGLFTRELALLPMLLEPGARPAEATFGTGIGLQVTIKLEDNLVVRTRQAQLRGGGTLTLRGTVAAPVVFGSLETRDGTVRFQRHRFALERAVIRFDDPRGFDPGLDVRATTRIRTWDITMELTGRASDVQVRLTSSPPMSQEDLLSLVALGSTREELGRSPGPVFAAAAGRALAEGLIGLGADTPLGEVFDSEAKDSDQPLVALGKTLTERTTVTYSGGFAEGGRQKLRMEYQVIGPLLLSGEQDFQGGFGGDVIVRLRYR
jgi:translocation and assembly module TamB